jgi:hypothetical protein
MKCFVILVMTGATGIKIKRLKLSVKKSKKEFNRFSTRTDLLGIQHEIRKVLQSETGSTSRGIHYRFKRIDIRKRKNYDKRRHGVDDDDNDNKNDNSDN